MSHDSHSHHISSPQLLVTTFLALVALTFLTVAVSFAQRDGLIDLGPWDMPVTLAIATAKALLVAVIFMHLQHDKLFNSILLIAGVIFMTLFIGMALLDSQQYQPQVQDFTYDKEAAAQ